MLRYCGYLHFFALDALELIMNTGLLEALQNIAIGLAICAAYVVGYFAGVMK